jgi:hypothetical protein
MRNYILQRRRSSVVLGDIAEEQFDGSRRRSSVLAGDLAAFKGGDPARRRSSAFNGFNGNRITNNSSQAICEDEEMLQFHDIIRNHKLPNGELGKLRRMSLEIESMVADDSLKKFLVTAIFITLFLISVIAFSIYQRIGS